MTMRSGKNWTREEEAQLAEWWGQFSIPTLARRLNRSENAIKERASRMGLGAHLASSELISFNVLLQEVGLSKGGSGYAWNYEKLKAAGLKIHTHRVSKKTFRMVDIYEFWKFAEKNRHLFDFSRLEENALGAEPAWVKAKRAEDYRRACMMNTKKRKWTE